MDYIWVDKKSVLKVSKKHVKCGYITAGEVIPAGSISDERMNLLIERGKAVKTFSDDNELKKENEKLKKQLKDSGDDKELKKLQDENEKLKKENEALKKQLEEVEKVNE